MMIQFNLRRAEWSRVAYMWEMEKYRAHMHIDNRVQIKQRRSVKGQRTNNVYTFIYTQCTGRSPLTATEIEMNRPTLANKRLCHELHIRLSVINCIHNLFSSAICTDHILVSLSTNVFTLQCILVRPTLAPCIRS